MDVIMYPNLKAEIARKGETFGSVANICNITSNTFSQKINGKSEFTIDEAMKIADFLEADMPLQILFKRF